MKIETGEIITLSNNKEYICFSTLADNGVDYLYLMSNFKPLEIRFAIQKVVNNEIEIEIINDYDEKQRILKLFQEKTLKN